MDRSHARRLAPAVLLPLLLLVTTGWLAGSAAADTQAAGRHPSRQHWRAITWTNTAPPIVIADPQCDEGGQCLYPWTEAGEAHGDVEGTYIASGVANANAVGALAVSRMDVVRGTIAGCGTGTVVLRQTEDLGPSPKPSQWQIVEGFGTGDLVHVQGHGTGIGAVTPTGLTTTLSGYLTCGT